MEDSSLPELAFTKEEPMKRFLHRLSLLFVVLLLLTTAVFADMGPKPQLTVIVEHAPSELYYLDLLAEGEYELICPCLPNAWIDCQGRCGSVPPRSPA